MDELFPDKTKQTEDIAPELLENKPITQKASVFSIGYFF